MGRRGILPTAASLRALSRSTSCSQRTWSCPCPTWHFLPRAAGITEIEMGALRGCGDGDRSECTMGMGMEMGASRAWEQGHRGVDGTTGMDRDVEGLGTPWAWRWWHQGAGEGDIEGWRGGMAGMELEAALGWGYPKVRSTVGCGLRAPGPWCLKDQVFSLAAPPHPASPSFCCVAGTPATSQCLAPHPHCCFLVTEVPAGMGGAGVSCRPPGSGGLLEPLCSHLLVPGVPPSSGGPCRRGRYWSGLCRR